RWRAVDELPVSPRDRESSFDDQLAIFARLKTVFLEKVLKRPCDSAGIEYSLNRASVRTGPDQFPVRPFSEDQTQSSDQNRLSGTGLAGNDIQARPQLQSQVHDQCKILDAQDG